MKRLLLSLCVLSGAAALLYEVLWLRLLTLSMGHTVGAVGTVLAAFMGGLAVGAWLSGRIGPSLTPVVALKTYASLEIVIAACALLLPFAWSAAQPILAWAYADAEGGRLFDVTRVVLCLVLLSIPTTAMGATYPLAVRSLAHMPQSRTNRRAGSVYAANTLGAAVGAALAGFVLLPTLGSWGTTIMAIALNAVAAVGALTLASHVRPAAAAVAEPSARSHTSSTKPTEKSRRKSSVGSTHDPIADATASRTSQLIVASCALGVSGFVALVYEVTWTRALAMVLGPTTYAFTAMLMAFITGLALGSAAATAMLSRIRRPRFWLGTVLIAAAVTALVASSRIDQLPLTMAAAAGRADVTFTSMLVLQIALVVALQLPMTIALGAAFPFAVAMATRDDALEKPAALTHDAVAQRASIVYASNTVGAIAGALAGSFLLIPLFGIQTSIRVAATIIVLAGLVVCWQELTGRSSRIIVGFAVLATLVWIVVAPAWNQERLANGGYRYATSLASGDLETGLEAGSLRYYREGAAGTVSVRQVPGVRSLAIDGKVDASNGGDMLTQKLLAHLPLLLHPDPRTVCIVGLGSGVTLGAALRHPIERAHVVEISTEVVAASEHFATENHRALVDQRTRLIVGDGRSHLLLSSMRYDVIISEPSNPWMAGVASLFTREFFVAARDRLTPGGILAQWAHTYSISDEDLRAIVATFLSVFPEGTAWLVGESDLLLIGSTTSISALDVGIDNAWGRAGVATDLGSVSARAPFGVLTLFVAGGQDLQRYAAGATVLEDEYQSLEYSAPRALYGLFQDSNIERLRQVAESAVTPAAVRQALDTATPQDWRDRGLMHLQADAPDRAFRDLQEAITRAPRDRDALDGFARAAVRTGRVAEAETFLSERASSAGSAPLLVELSALLAAGGRTEEAVDRARQAISLEPTNSQALEQLVAVYADQGDVEALNELTRALEHIPHDRFVGLYGQAALAYLQRDFKRSGSLGEELVAADSQKASAFDLLGSTYAELGQHERARQAFEASLEMVPRNPAVLTNLGMMELRLRNPRAAADRFAEALFLNATFVPALEGLAQALEAQGRTSRAAAIRALIPDR